MSATIPLTNIPAFGKETESEYLTKPRQLTVQHLREMLDGIHGSLVVANYDGVPLVITGDNEPLEDHQEEMVLLPID